MINIIKTGIITIVISFISGLLLDYYQKLAPKILCNIGKGVPVEIDNKKLYAYIITIKNVSNKTIHELTLHVQSTLNNIQISDAKITKGLKFDSSIKDNILDVNIPFLSKDDEFSVKIYVEEQDGVQNKPTVIIRSPEKFKQVNSVEQKGAVNKKKVMIIATSIILLMIVGGVGKFYLNGKSADTKIQTPSVKTKVEDKSTDSKESTGETTKDTDEKSSEGEKTKNTDKKPSTDGTKKKSDDKSSTNGTDDKSSTSGTIKGTDGKSSTDGADEKPSTDEKTNGTDDKSSTSGTTKGTDGKSSTDGTTNGADEKPSTGETTGSKDK